MQFTSVRVWQNFIQYRRWTLLGCNFEISCTNESVAKKLFEEKSFFTFLRLPKEKIQVCYSMYSLRVHFISPPLKYQLYGVFRKINCRTGLSLFFSLFIPGSKYKEAWRKCMKQKNTLLGIKLSSRRLFLIRNSI